MSTAELTGEAKPKAPPSAPPRLERGFWMRAAIIAVAVLLVIILLPQILSLYYVDAMTQVAIYAVVALGLGVLVGRVGLISLGQAAVLAIGAWVAARLLFGTSLPYEVVLLASGVITMLLGTLVGLPGAAHARPVPGAHHPDAGRRDHRRPGVPELPQRRPWLQRLQRRAAAHPADPPPGHRPAPTRRTSATRSSWP